MKSGKLSAEQLASLIFPYTGAARSDILVPAAAGEDAAVIDFGDWACVASTDPITGAGERAGWYAVHVACNDLAATGAEPVALLITLLLPEDGELADAGRVMREADEAARSLGVTIAGGHTEVTSAVNRLVISTTAIGRAPQGRWIATGDAHAGDALVLTKAAALEGTAILAADLAARLAPHVAAPLLEHARTFADELSIVPDAAAARAAGATGMHDATEGGVLGAACELAIASHVGVEIDEARVPVRPETRAICDALRLDPLRLIASGALVIAAPDGEQMVAALQQAGIEAAVIGRLIPQGFYLIRNASRENVIPSSDDELWRALQTTTKGGY